MKCLLELFRRFKAWIIERPSEEVTRRNVNLLLGALAEAEEEIVQLKKEIVQLRIEKQ